MPDAETQPHGLHPDPAGDTVNNCFVSPTRTRRSGEGSMASTPGPSSPVRRGELVGPVGENGSGKSTLMHIIVGLMREDAGAIALSGQVGYCPQIPLLYDKLTATEHLRLFERPYGMTDVLVSAHAELLPEELAVSRYRRRLVQELSGGTRQKAEPGDRAPPRPGRARPG